MKQRNASGTVLLLALVAAACGALVNCGGMPGMQVAATTTVVPAGDVVAAGRQIFRYDTFGDEASWTGQLRLHQAIDQALSPTMAPASGRQVDAEALPASL